MLSKLPRDMAEEVLCKLPVTSLRGVRFTCKNWNALSRDRRFIQKRIRKAKAAAAKNKEFQVVMMLDYKVFLFTVDLFKVKPSISIEPVAKLISLDDDDDADRVYIFNISHCDGLLLCLTTKVDLSSLVVWNPSSGHELSSLVVWNPCSGQTRSIQPRTSFTIFDKYALGHEVNNIYSSRKYKVLRFVDHYGIPRTHWLRRFEIYNLHTNAWKVLDVKPDWDIAYYHHGVSINGNTYWYAREKMPLPEAGQRVVVSHLHDFLLCFDFTTERFGPRLRLPFRADPGDTVVLSSVKGTQIAVLCQKGGHPSLRLEIWISSQIKPDSVSWNKLFLQVDMKPLTGFKFYEYSGSFFVDEKQKVAVVLDKDRGKPNPTRNYTAYVIGNEGYFKKVDLGESTHRRCWPLVCPYVPTSMPIKQAAPQHNQKTA